MNIFEIWWVDIICYLTAAVVYNQSYKIATKKVKKPGALVVIIDLVGGLTALSLCIFTGIKFPNNPLIYLFLIISITFYALSDRINGSVRKELPTSTVVILKQLSTVFVIISGILLFKEPLIITKIIGAALIIISNMLAIYEKGKIMFNKYVFFSIIASVAFTIGLLLDINNSTNFALPMYVSFILIGPALLITIFDKINLKDIKREVVYGNRKIILSTALSYGILNILLLKAYQLQSASIVAPLLSLSVILNVIAGFFILKERKNVLYKIIASILIIISIILIKT